MSAYGYTQIAIKTVVESSEIYISLLEKLGQEAIDSVPMIDSVQVTGSTSNQPVILRSGKCVVSAIVEMTSDGAVGENPRGFVKSFETQCDE